MALQNVNNFSWLQLVNCGLCDETIAALEKRNIRSLFPIQKHVFEPAQQGRDLIGRARTGSGKTLAFALPVIENLLQVRDLRHLLLPPMQGIIGFPRYKTIEAFFLPLSNLL